MKYITVVISKIDDENCSSGEDATDSVVEGEAIHYITLLDDGTGVALYQLRGDLEESAKALEEDPEVLSIERSEAADGLVYLHFQADALMTELLSLFRRHEVVVDWPMEYTTRGALRITWIGDDEKIREVIREIPEGVQVTLEGIGEYHSDMRQLASLLTERQRELLKLAIDLGYYDVPRQVGLREIADEIDLSVATVGEHLQKIEARILSQAVL
ncbi:helix-turn-helix domain-containing protein (plasmid) [Haladaptatus sp. SPP-AMP-3]|uniref:helix-turn-helix domain-containing protein n=1 Tax=Haladaptatus sp. SPP-AMP-3 TaxID=3121295 RepID=UPI003C30C4AB